MCVCTGVHVVQSAPFEMLPGLKLHYVAVRQLLCCVSQRHSSYESVCRSCVLYKLPMGTSSALCGASACSLLASVMQRDRCCVT